jgi:hypothetical protein
MSARHDQVDPVRCRRHLIALIPHHDVGREEKNPQDETGNEPRRGRGQLKRADREGDGTTSIRSGPCIRVDP